MTAETNEPKQYESWNQEHFKLLENHSYSIEKWKAENPGKVPRNQDIPFFIREWQQENVGAVLNLKGAHLSGFHLEGADLQGASLEKAHLDCTHLEGANLQNVHLEGAHLFGAHLQGANLNDAHLQGANLQRSHLEGANLRKAHLEGANFKFSFIDGGTFMDFAYIDRKTDFTGVGLESARIHPVMISKLKRNIREIQRRAEWDEKQFHPFLIQRCFWWMSDYGSSTRRILWTFAGFSILFALVYLMPHMFDWEPFVNGLNEGKVEGVTMPLEPHMVGIRALYLSVVTMTTLGFGDITANPFSVMGHILVMAQVFIGYIILGALITRLSIMFQEVR